MQSRQIKDALASGLLVDVYPAGGTNDNNDDDEVDFCSPESLPLEIDRKGNQNPTDLEAFMHDESKVDEFGADDDDSDDDLL